MDILIKSVQCPICGAPEEENGKLLIRGFKVHKSGIWWSQCISGRDHETFTAVYEDGTEEEINFPDKPWFGWKDEDTFLVEVNGRDYPFNTSGSR